MNEFKYTIAKKIEMVLTLSLCPIVMLGIFYAISIINEIKWLFYIPMVLIIIFIYPMFRAIIYYLTTEFFVDGFGIIIKYKNGKDRIFWKDIIEIKAIDDKTKRIELVIKKLVKPLKIDGSIKNHNELIELVLASVDKDIIK